MKNKVKMNKVLLGILIGVVFSAGGFVPSMSSQKAAAPVLQFQKTGAANLTKGNGAPSGAHYNLNIIGVPKGKTADMPGSSGHRIFVPLTGSCQIKLGEGTFQVLDANCTDAEARFQLPNPDPTNSGTTTYSVWPRALGKPGGSSETTTCATDPADGQLYCSVYTMVQLRDKGKSTFTNVSKTPL